jgi:transposase
MNATATYGIDIAKNVFQIHWVDPNTGEIHSRRLARAKVSEFFAPRAPARIVIEACGGAHHWGRVLAALGHQVELLPPHQVRAFVCGNKDDAADARGIWLAAQHQDIRRVPVKSEQQQAELSAHRMRSHWVSMRTATSNALRSLLYEFGVVLPKGKNIALRQIALDRAQIEARLPPLMGRLLDEQLQALREIETHVEALERELEVVRRTNEVAQRLYQVPGIGVLGATALASTLGDGLAWRNAREFACCLGLAPAHSGTGGKVRMGKISKRGDSYLRTLLIHGARNLVRVAHPPEWIARMLARRPFNVVATAVAHKLAKIAWAMAAHQTSYEKRWSKAPQVTH